MLGELSYRQGLRLRRRLLQAVCSSSWLDAIAPADANGYVRTARRGLYPPGGEATAMRECPACRRISPPNSPQPVCGDCEIETVELAFSQRCARSTHSQRRELQRLWWRSPLRFDLSDADDSVAPTWTSLVQNPAGAIRGWAPSENATDGFADEFSPNDDDHADSPSGSDETSSAVRDDRLAAAEYAHWLLGLPTRQIAYYDPIPKSSLSLLPADVASELLRLTTEFAGQMARSIRAATTAFRRACRPLESASIRGRRGLIELRYAGRCYGLLRYASDLPTRNVSIGSGRSAGCVLTLLPENEAALRREIAFAEANEDVVPSAKRFTRSNPFRSAPEDRFGLRAFLGSRRTASTNDGNLRPRPSAPIATR